MFESANGTFYLVTGRKLSTGGMLYIIDSHFWYDYDYAFMETKPWKPIYQKNGQDD